MADIKISELLAAGSIVAVDFLEIVQTATNKKATMAQLGAYFLTLGKYSTVVGDGSATNISITHNLNSRNLHVSLRRAVAPFEEFAVDNEATTANSILLKFGAVAPTPGQYVVTITV